MKFILKDNTEIHIAEGETKDAKNLVNYVKVIADQSKNLTFSSDEFNVTIKQEEKILEKYLQSTNSVYALAKFDNKIIGAISMASGTRNRTKHVGIFSMSVLQSYWNKGIGSALITYLLDFAKTNQQTTKIALEVRTDNVAAIKLYKKFGFKVEGTHPNQLFIEQQYYSVFSMGLIL